MNKRIKKLWIEALRSGKFKQGFGQLRRGRTNVRHCCLGVLCEIAVNQGVLNHYKGAQGLLPPEVMDWAELDDDDPMLAPLHDPNCYAAKLNDNGHGFQNIAERIEKYL